MKVGVSGHQRREGVDWDWVTASIRRELSSLRNIQATLSSLALGTDQIFAQVALDLKIPVIAVLPLEGYERFFRQGGLASYRRLVRRCEIIQLRGTGNANAAFLRAGKFIVENCDLLVAVWDGEPASGLGGTADVVLHAKKISRPVIHIDPIRQQVDKKI